EQWFRVARGAFRFVLEELVTAFGGFGIEAPCGWRRRSETELVLMEPVELRRDAVLVRIDHDVTETVLCRDGKARCVVEPRVEEVTDAVHLQNGDERVPIRNGSPSGVRMEVDAGESER